MVNLQTVRANNSALKELGPNLVAVFVGGTSGIGLTTAREFVRNTVSPHVYLVGRNQTEATKIIDEFKTINPSSETSFIKSDVSLLRNVDTACTEIASKESKINLLFLTTGFLTMKGRDETPEGLDKKFSVNYYSRLRFTQNLLPLLTAASTSGQLSRVISVLDAHRVGTNLVLDDLSLKNNFTLSNCLVHATTMNSLSLEHLATQNPGTSFIHAYPGGVKTNVLREFNPIFQAGVKAFGFLLAPFMVDLKESGERHLYAATSKAYAPKSKAEETQVRGSLGKGSGAYWLHWDGENVGESTFRKMAELREKGVVEKVWAHTEEVFKKVCEEGEKY